MHESPNITAAESTSYPDQQVNNHLEDSNQLLKDAILDLSSLDIEEHKALPSASYYQILTKTAAESKFEASSSVLGSRLSSHGTLPRC